MFGHFLQTQFNMRAKRLTIKKQDYEPFHIPIQKIKKQKPIIKKIVAQCEKLRSTFEFIKQEINRENSRKRTQFSSTLRKNISLVNLSSMKNSSIFTSRANQNASQGTSGLTNNNGNAMTIAMTMSKSKSNCDDNIKTRSKQNGKRRSNIGIDLSQLTNNLKRQNQQQNSANVRSILRVMSKRSHLQ